MDRGSDECIGLAGLLIAHPPLRPGRCQAAFCSVSSGTRLEITVRHEEIPRATWPSARFEEEGLPDRLFSRRRGRISDRVSQDHPRSPLAGLCQDDELR